MTTVSTLQVLISANIAGLQAGIQQANRDVEGFGSGLSSRMRSAGQSLTQVGAQMSLVTAPLLGFGRAGLDVADSFDQSMDAIAARTGLTGAALKRIEDEAMRLGSTTAFSGQQVSEAFLQILTSGSSVEETFALIGPVLDAAAASGEDLGRTADVVTDILAAFGLQATDGAAVVEALAKASGASSADMGSLGEGFANVGGKAAAFGLDVEETAAILAIFSENGVKGAEAGTQLRSMLTNMTRDTTDVKAAWNALGTSMYDAEGAMRPLDEVIKDIEAGLEGMTDEEKNRIINDLAGSYGELGLRALMGSISMDDMITKMEESAGAAEIARKQLDNMAGDADALQGAVERLQYRAFMPLIDGSIRPLLQFGTEVVNMLADWVEANPELTRIILEFGAALAVSGPLALALGVAMTALASPVFLLVAGLAAGAVAIRNLLPLMSDFYETVRSRLGGVDWSQITDPIKRAFDELDIAGKAQVVIDKVSGVFSTVSTTLTTIAPDFTTLRTTVETAIDNAVNGLDLAGRAQVVIDKITGVFTTVTTTLSTITFDLTPLRTQVETTFDTAMGGIDLSTATADVKATIEGALNGTTIDLTPITTWGNENFDTIASTLVSISSVMFGGPFGAALGIASLVKSAIENDFLGLGTFIEESGIQASIESAIGGISQMINDVVNSVFGGGGEGPDFSGVGGAINDGMGNFAGEQQSGGILDGLGRSLETGLTFIQDIFNRIGPGIGEAIGNFFSGIEGFIKAISDTDTTGLREVVNAIGSVLGVIVDIAASALGAGIETVLNTLGDVLPHVGEGISNIIEAVGSLGQGDISGVVTNLGEAIGSFASGLLTIPENIGNGVLSFIERLTGSELPSIGEIVEDARDRVKIAADDIGRFFEVVAIRVELTFARIAESINRSLYNITVVNDPTGLIPDVALDTALLGRVSELENRMQGIGLGERVRGMIDTALTGGQPLDLSQIVTDSITVNGETFNTTLEGILRSMDGASLEAWATLASSFGEGGKASIKAALEGLASAGNWSDFELLVPLAVALGIDTTKAKSDFWTTLHNTLNNIGVQVSTLISATPIVSMAQSVGSIIQGLLAGLSVDVPVDVNVTGLPPQAEDNSEGPFSSGMRWVPRDGFLARLDAGEAVLTRAENRQYRQMMAGMRLSTPAPALPRFESGGAAGAFMRGGDQKPAKTVYISSFGESAHQLQAKMQRLDREKQL